VKEVEGEGKRTTRHHEGCRSPPSRRPRSSTPAPSPHWPWSSPDPPASRLAPACPPRPSPEPARRSSCAIASPPANRRRSESRRRRQRRDRRRPQRPQLHRPGRTHPGAHRPRRHTGEVTARGERHCRPLHGSDSRGRGHRRLWCRQIRPQSTRFTNACCNLYIQSGQTVRASLGSAAGRPVEAMGPRATSIAHAQGRVRCRSVHDGLGGALRPSEYPQQRFCPSPPAREAAAVEVAGRPARSQSRSRRIHRWRPPRS
jgi:hypothetical protein